MRPQRLLLRIYKALCRGRVKIFWIRWSRYGTGMRNPIPGRNGIVSTSRLTSREALISGSLLSRKLCLSIGCLMIMKGV